MRLALVALGCALCVAGNPIPSTAEWGRGGSGSLCLNENWKSEHSHPPPARSAWPKAIQTVNDPRFAPSWTVAAFNARGAKAVRLSSTNNVSGSIVVEYDSWESAGITEHVASILLREVIGYEVVLLPRTAHLEGLGADGVVAEQQPTHMQLEMWAAGRQALIDLWTVEKGSVKQVGTVGYSGQVR